MIPASRRRLLVLYVVLAAMLAALGGRLWYLQALNGTQYRALAVANQTRDIVVPAVRGEILDDDGRQLVTNQTSLVVSVNMMQLSRQGRRRCGGAAPARAAARHVLQRAEGQDDAVHQGRQAAVLDRLALPADPGR